MGKQAIQEVNLTRPWRHSFWDREGRV